MKGDVIVETDDKLKALQTQILELDVPTLGGLVDSEEDPNEEQVELRTYTGWENLKSRFGEDKPLRQEYASVHVRLDKLWVRGAKWGYFLSFSRIVVLKSTMLQALNIPTNIAGGARGAEALLSPKQLFLSMYSMARQSKGKGQTEKDSEENMTSTAAEKKEGDHAASSGEARAPIDVLEDLAYLRGDSQKDKGNDDLPAEDMDNAATENGAVERASEHQH